MKFTVARSEFLETLSVVSKGLSARSTLPILSGILVDTQGGEIILQTTDLEISIRRSSPALIEREGRVVLPGKLLTDIVRSLPEAAVTVEIEGDVALIRCQHSAFTLKTLKATDFPKFPEVPTGKKVTLPAEVLQTMVKHVSRAVSRDETRAVLTGILLVIEGSLIRMVATDSYRLAVKETNLEQIKEEIEVVIPGKALEEVTRMASSGETINIGISENQIIFEFGNTTFVTRRVEGSFVNYKQLIPRESKTTVVLSREDIISAVKRVSLMAIHNTPIKFSVNIEDQIVSLSSSSQDVGDASEDINSKIEGDNLEIAFNHAFIIDGLNSTNTDTIMIELQSSLKPGLIRTIGDDGFMYLIMPVRLS